MEVDMTQLDVYCTNCGKAYPEEGVPFQCPSCGGLFDFKGEFNYNPAKIDRSQPGIWRFRQAFNFPPNLDPVSLGEGSTSLVWVKSFGRQVACKCEFTNPSGSFKDRGSATIIAWLKWRGVNEAIEDSSGNAGASLAAYAGRAGIKARIYVPGASSGPKLKQIEAYGAELILVPGSRSDTSEAAKNAADKGMAYASHAYLPFNLPGYATTAYEIFDQLGQMPGTVIVPAGQGGLLLGLARGFNALRIANTISFLPKIIGVQAQACAPLWAKFQERDIEPGSFAENQTLAEGVKVTNPLRIEAVIKAIKESRGSICIANEGEILPARDSLGSLGLYIEPTSAIVWVALAKMIHIMNDPIVVILTGSGLKYG